LRKLPESRWSSGSSLDHGKTFAIPIRETSLTYEHDKRPDEIDITTGSLDHSEDFPPTKDVYPEERLPWVDLVHH